MIPTVVPYPSPLLAFGLADAVPWRLGLLCCAIVLGTSLLFQGWRAARGTTLTAVWGWGLLSFWCLALIEAVAWAAGGGKATAVHDALQYVAAVTTFCPMLAQLGAKRPQVQVWPLVVVSLWVVLCLPAAEFLLLRQGALMEMSQARRWFLTVLMLVGCCNNLPNRFWPSVVLLVFAQFLLLHLHLPGGIPRFPVEAPTLWALFAIAAASLLQIVGWPKTKERTAADRIWFDFRNAYGALWALRLAQRVNEDSAQDAGGIRLTWSGFQSGDDRQIGSPDPEDPSVRRFQSLLTRFVSAHWIASRITDSTDARAASAR